MAVRALQALVLLLTVVAGFEIGYLARPAPPAPRVLFASAAPCPAPPFTSPPPAAEPPPPRSVDPPRPVARRKQPSGDASRLDARAIADCARSGGPLCGIPK